LRKEGKKEGMLDRPKQMRRRRLLKDFHVGAVGSVKKPRGAITARAKGRLL
jgi:hypothetical protein